MLVVVDRFVIPINYTLETIIGTRVVSLDDTVDHLQVILVQGEIGW